MTHETHAAHVPADLFDADGFMPKGGPKTGAALASLGKVAQNVEFDAEEDVEAMDDRRELVTYCVVYRPEGTKVPVPDSITYTASYTEVLVGHRQPKAGEERLHDSVFFGWGGGVERRDFEDAGGPSEDWKWSEDCLFDAAERELMEELTIKPLRGVYEQPCETIISYEGLIVSDEDDVSKDHLAVVFSLPIREAKVAESHKYGSGIWVPCGAIETGQFPDKSNVVHDDDSWEHWSDLLADHINDLCNPYQEV